MIRLTHQQLELPTLYRELMALIRRGVPYEASCWHTIDPATHLITGDFPEEFVALGYPARMGFAMFCANEYLVDDVIKFVDMYDQHQPSASLSGATQGRHELSARYRDLFAPFDIRDEVRFNLTPGGRLWGGVNLVRSGGDFAPQETALLARLAPRIGQAVRLALLRPALSASGTDAPGLVLIDTDWSWEATGPAEIWLAELGHPGAPPERLPAAVIAAASAARAASDSADRPFRGAAHSRVRTRSGRWLDVHGSLLEARRGSQVAVIIEPAHPMELASAVGDAYELTQREREVMTLVLQGIATHDIAARLSISPYTVQDHLKSIFDKTGVRNRRQLQATVFYGQMWSRTSTNPEIGPDGWYADSPRVS